MIEVPTVSYGGFARRLFLASGHGVSPRPSCIELRRVENYLGKRWRCRAKNMGIPNVATKNKAINISAAEGVVSGGISFSFTSASIFAQ